MKIKEIEDNYYFENLSENHDLSDFDCGDKDLNDFLKNDALAQQNARLNVTKLIMCDGNIIGFTSLLTDAFILKNLKNEKIKLKIKDKLNLNSNKKTVPAVKIGRLAIDKRYSGKGLGTHILGSIINNLKLKAETEIGFRFIIVEGYAKAFKFYVMKNGFEYLKKDYEHVKNLDFIIKRDSKKPFYLYFDLDDF